MYGLAVNLTISLSGHLSNIDEIDEIVVFLTIGPQSIRVDCQFVKQAKAMIHIRPNDFCVVDTPKKFEKKKKKIKS